jgi:hypothetical protein
VRIVPIDFVFASFRLSGRGNQARLSKSASLAMLAAILRASSPKKNSERLSDVDYGIVATKRNPRRGMRPGLPVVCRLT